MQALRDSCRHMQGIAHNKRQWDHAAKTVIFCFQNCCNDSPCVCGASTLTKHGEHFANAVFDSLKVRQCDKEFVTVYLLMQITHVQATTPILSATCVAQVLPSIQPTWFAPPPHRQLCSKACITIHGNIETTNECSFVNCKIYHCSCP